MLKDVEFKNIYSSGLNEPKEFFTEALIESKALDLGLGFFSSSGIRSLAYGFALFIANGGKMRVVINNILSKDDKDAIEKGQKEKIEDFEEKILFDIERLTKTLTGADKHFFKCLSYLVSIGKIEFVATISAKGGLAHDKYGIFTDEEGKKVAFIGSANFSQTALEANGETITVFSSDQDAQRILEYQELFEKTWKYDTSHLVHIPIESVKTHLVKSFPDITLDGLIEEEKDIRNENQSQSEKTYYRPLPERILEKIERKEQEPRFPFPEERIIQKEAYKSWIENGKSGIFAMATGTGKTVTALNCILKQYKENGFYKAIIVVPTQALALQWQREAESFNFKNIISTYTDKDWRETLNSYKSLSLVNSRHNIIIITTYSTFNRNDMQYFVKNTKGMDTFIYVADEAHNIGSPTTLKKLPTNIKWRIGLSATPERVYDDIGSNELMTFFNSAAPNYTYKFTMKDAIDSNILCHYDYFPIFVSLTNEEMDEYIKITKMLYKLIDPETGKYKKPDADMKLLERKRIIHKAENKKEALIELLDSFNELKFAFVFVPEGYEHDYSDSDSYNIKDEDTHIINEYANIFKSRNYRYHQYISGLHDARGILKSFADGDIQVLLSMKCLDEGVDIPRAEYAIFCSSTGNPRQFVQRRGRVLRKCKGKEKAKIWDLVVVPPVIHTETSSVETNLFMGEVKRIVNFAALADNKIDILYGKLHDVCLDLGIDLFKLLENEYELYN